MRSALHPSLERARVKEPAEFASEPDSGPMGFFVLPGPCGERLKIVSSDGRDWPEIGLPPPAWEHVSVSLLKAGRAFYREPNWKEMCFVKELFWEDEERVIQYHPKKSEYVNVHDRTLHLWRPVGVDLPMPPMECV